MDLQNLIMFFIAGIIVGSFLNVIIFRIDDLQSIIRDRSRCRHCNETISWYDLIPVLSYFFLKGKCRFCGSKISYQYPIVEIVAGLIFALSYHYFGLSLALFFYLIVFSLLIIVAVHDIMTQYVPEFFVWSALVLLALGGWYFGHFSVLNAIYGASISGGVLALLVWFSKEKWMGSGDIKIGIIMGLMVGFPRSVFALFAAFILGSIAGLLYIYFAKKTMKDALPFAPFLILGSLVSLFWGQKIIDWYLGKIIF